MRTYIGRAAVRPRTPFIRERQYSRPRALLFGTLLLAGNACESGPDQTGRGAARAGAADSAGAPAAGSVRRHTAADSLLADSAAADSAAFASLPPRLRDDLEMGPLLSERALQDSALAYCQPLSDPTDREVRKRLQGRWPAQLAVVLFVRADRASGTVNRVELVRHVEEEGRGRGQRGYIWDRDTDETQAIEWAPGRSAPETYRLPKGTPTPRVLRGLGRRLLVLPCSGARPGL